MVGHTRRRLPHAPRLPGFDYATPGAYFVTICTARRRPILARIAGGRVRLTPDGRCVAAAWRWVLAHYPAVHLTAGVIMPDHLHVVLTLRPTSDRRPAVSAVVGAMKTRAARLINARHGTPAVPVWQRSFHDRVLRSPHALYYAIRYIHENPKRWARAHPGPPAAPVEDP